MTTTDTIEHILDHGIVTLTIGRSPKRNLPYVQAGQIVRTDSNENHVQLTHQIEGASLVECLTVLRQQVEHANGLTPKLITPRRNSN